MRLADHVVTGLAIVAIVWLVSVALASGIRIAAPCDTLTSLPWLQCR